jgi:serine/threonine protein kinase
MNPLHCPSCHGFVPADAPGGLCPACALRRVIQPTVLLPPQGAPAMDEIAAAFPDLEIFEILGQGGMGVVYKARQPRLDRMVALKILPPHLAVQPGFAGRFTREARALAKLSHPHIVGVHDFGESGGFYFLLMEYVDGVNLRAAIRAGIKPEQALLLVPHICGALQFAHDRGVLHRDIKPENILLDRSGIPKLADFGIAKLAGEEATGLTQSGAALGTAAYMAPEQVEKPATVDHRADIYSLGVVLYEMLTGELPLGRFAAPSEKSSVGERVDAVVMRALKKNANVVNRAPAK